MAGDGISVPTTLSQMGAVAKTQARGQQSPTQVTPFSEQQDKRDELKVQRVKETKQAEQEKIDPDGDSQDRRKRRRQRRNKILRAKGDEGRDGDQDIGQEDEPDREESLGLNIDLRV